MKGTLGIGLGLHLHLGFGHSYDSVLQVGEAVIGIGGLVNLDSVAFDNRECIAVFLEEREAQTLGFRYWHAEFIGNVE